MSRCLRPTVILLLALAAAGPAPAQAPQRPDRPYRGLFGRGGSDPNESQWLDLNVSVYGGYDDNVLAGQSSGGGGQYISDPRFQQSGGLGGSSLSLAYGKRVERATMDLSAGTSYRYFPSASELTGLSSWASLGLSLRLTERTTVGASQSVSYSPYYTFGNFAGLDTAVPGDLVVTNPEYSLLERPAVSYFSTASLSHRVTPRASLSIDYSLRYVDYRESGQEPLRDAGGGGLFSYRLTRHASARLGYHYRRGSYGRYWGSRPIERHDIDVGVDYSRSLSISRRTTVAFGTGSSVVRSFDDPNRAVLRTHYMVTGNASLMREIGRSWRAGLHYRRGLQMVEGFPDPFFSDSVLASVGGYVGRRARLSFNGMYSSGDIGLSAGGQGYRTYTGGASCQFALARWAALYADYFYYYYLFDRAVTLPAGMGRGLDRNGVRVGLNLWAPLVR